MPRMKDVVVKDESKTAVGIKIDKELWSRFRQVCFMKKRTATEVVEELMQDYTRKYNALLNKFED